MDSISRDDLFPPPVSYDSDSGDPVHVVEKVVGMKITAAGRVYRCIGCQGDKRLEQATAIEENPGARESCAP